MSKQLFDLVCECGNSYSKMYEPETVSRSYFKAICPECTKKKIASGVKKWHKKRIDDTPYEKLTLHRRRLVLWEDQNHKCSECGYDKYSIVGGPYELDHVDGNWKNTSKSNERILCCNCHAMTSNFRFKGRHHTQESKDKIKVNMSKPGKAKVARSTLN